MCTRSLVNTNNLKNLNMSKIPANEVIESIGRYLLSDVLPVVLDLKKSNGNKLVDANTGKSYLDCYSYFASNPIGHNHPKMFEPEFEQRLLDAARSKPSNSDIYTAEMAAFVDTFSQIALPKEFKHLFFVEGGALAVENALKTAFDWKIRKNISEGLSDELGSQIIHFKQAFHGRSGYTLSLTNTRDPRKTIYFPKFEWPRILNPKIRFPLDDEQLQTVIEMENKAVEEIEQAFLDNPNDIAGIIIEPIQGEGGDNHFRAEFHQSLRRLADKYDALLIYDEVQSGLGLTGKMWAYQHYGIVPDIVAFGKKTQVCGIMAGERIDEVKDNVFVEPSRINSTWGGSLVDMVRSQRYLEIIAEDSLVENAAAVGEYLRTKLLELSEREPKLLNNVRGCGLMCAIDLNCEESRDKAIKECIQNGILVLKCGYTGIRFRPSLTFSKAEADELIEVLQSVFSKVAPA